MLRRWKENFEEQMNGENEMERKWRMRNLEQEVRRISKDEVREALKRMKAVGSDEIWKHPGEKIVEFLTTTWINVILDREKMPEE